MWVPTALPYHDKGAHSLSYQDSDSTIEYQEMLGSILIENKQKVHVLQKTSWKRSMFERGRIMGMKQ